MVRKNFARFAPIYPKRKADHHAELIEALSLGLSLPEVDQVIRDFRNRVATNATETAVSSHDAIVKLVGVIDLHATNSSGAVTLHV